MLECFSYNFFKRERFKIEVFLASHPESFTNVNTNQRLKERTRRLGVDEQWCLVSKFARMAGCLLELITLRQPLKLGQNL